MRSPRIETYKNFPTLRAPGQEIPLTPEQIEEYVKCSQDPMYFLTHYYTITSLDHGEIIFDPYPYQRDFLQTILDNRFIAILAARQLGKSVLVGGYYLWDILFNPNHLLGYYSRTADDAKKILGRIKMAYERVPLWLQKGVLEWQKGSIQLENQSKIEAGATTANSGRGGSYNCVCISGDTLVTVKSLDEDRIYDISIEDLFVEIQCDESLRILTPEGYVKFRTVVYNGEKDCYKISTKSNKQLTCTKTHKIFIDSENCVEAQQLRVGDKIFTKDGLDEIVEIHTDVGTKKVFDIVNVGDKNRFFANGITVHNCLDEYAFIPRNIQEDFMASAFPTINSGNTTKVIMITTPNGHDLFHKIYTESQLGLNNFKTYKVIWSAHPNRDEKWKKETIDAIGYKKFRVEHECEFEGSAATAISADVIAKLHFKNPISTNYLSEDNPECTFKVYEHSQPGALYWMQIDPGEGVGNDFTTIQILKIIPGDILHFKQVATWKANNYNAESASAIIYNLAKEYNDSFICVETNGLGASISDKLWDNYEYENLIFTHKNNKFGRYDILLGNYVTGAHKGIHTTNSTKIRGASKLENDLSKGILEIVDKDTIDELNHFVKVGSTYKAEQGYHDDLVMPLVLFAWVNEIPTFVDIVNENSTKETEVEEEVVSPLKAQNTKDNTGWDPIFWK